MSAPWTAGTRVPPAPSSAREAPPRAPSPKALRDAHAGLRRVCPTSPLRRHPALDAFVGCEVWVKCEHLLPTGAFKIRGAYHLLATMAQAGDTREVVAASRGNHGQALARACAEYGRRCVIFVPFGNSPLKDTRMRALGARVIQWGDTFDEASAGARAYAFVRGGHLVNPGDTPALVEGNASMGLELASQLTTLGLTDVDAVVAPVGVGSCAAALGLGLRAAGWPWPLVGAQSDRAPAMYESWRRGVATPLRAGTTVADGLAVGEPPPYTGALLEEVLDDFMLVEERCIVEAMDAYLRAWGAGGTPGTFNLAGGGPRRPGLSPLHGVVEGAGAAALACARDLVRARPEVRRVVVVASGANADPVLRA